MDKLEQAKKTFEEGIKLFQKKNFKEAQIYFEKTLEIAPNSSPTLENLSKSYLETNDYDKAEKTLKYFISLSSSSDILFKANSNPSPSGSFSLVNLSNSSCIIGTPSSKIQYETS